METTIKDLMDAVEEEIRGQWPEATVYRGTPPEEIERPSFALECRKDETVDVNRWTVSRTVVLAVRHFAAADGSDGSRAGAGTGLRELTNLFAAKALAVGDRRLNASEVQGTDTAEGVEVTVSFAYCDRRPEASEVQAPMGTRCSITWEGPGTEQRGFCGEADAGENAAPKTNR